jgi:hypothetical protein
MKNLIRTLLTSGLAATSLAALSADFDGSQPLLCATQYVSQCDTGMDCVNVFPASVNVPDFFLVNAQDKVIGAVNDERTTAIERIEHLDGKLVLQGADDGIEDVRDGVAWSMSIDEDTGKLVLSASGDGFAMVIFGACARK